MVLLTSTVDNSTQNRETSISASLYRQGKRLQFLQSAIVGCTPTAPNKLFSYHRCNFEIELEFSIV